MKLRQRMFIVACMLVFGASIGVRPASAQVWSHYDCQITNVFFNPVASGTLLPVTGFRDFVGNPDPDDGMTTGVGTGFSFDYNGTTYNNVNVDINGYVTVGNLSVPTITNDNTYVFNPHEPNNTLAPFFGDHFYRTLEVGYHPSQIQYQIVAFDDPNTNAPAGSKLHIFTVEWKDLNINDKTNPNSIATFQLKLIENPLANDVAVPDTRVTIEFDYGNIGSVGTVVTQGATVGIEDSSGNSHMNGLFPSSVANGDSTRLSTTQRTNAWPPAGLPGRVIQFVPKGTALLNQWGDGDVSLDQILNPNANIRANQNLFVTLADADQILISRTNVANGSNTYFGILDSVEGGPAFHGDCNHNGRYVNPVYPGYFFYQATTYDAAYILLYLAAKLPVLPWPNPLPVPPYKEADSKSTNISGIALDVRSGVMNGTTLSVPVVLRGTVNGALSLEAVVTTDDQEALQFVGTRSAAGALTLVRSNGKNGAVVLATSGAFEDGAVLGYLEFTVGAKRSANIQLDHVSINDEAFAGPSVNVPQSTLDVSPSANGFAVEQNVPNPFNLANAKSTSIRFTMGVAQDVTVRVFDMLGHEVRTLAMNEGMTSGPHSIEWDGRTNGGSFVANGLYYYQITSPSFTQTVKMQVIR